MQRSDGGWPPCAAVDQSTWVTSFASMALVGQGSGAVLAGARAWLLHHSGCGVSNLDRLRNWIMRTPGDQTPSGWSWYPGTASWVIPTAASLLALNKMSTNSTSLERERVVNGRGFLMARECAGGGWNHGGTFVHSETAEPYPETTGLALLALRDEGPVRLELSLARARQMLCAPQSVQGAAWLRMGLAAHGSNATLPVTDRNRNWTTVDTALEEIASLAQKSVFDVKP